MKILCFGSLNIDHTYQVDHFLEPGETSAVTGYDIHAGGKGLNQAIALAKAGAEVYMAGCVGHDAEELLKALTGAGVHTDFVKEVETPSGHAVIQVDRTGQNCILIFHGANFCITQEQIDKTLKEFAECDVLLLQNEICLIDELARKAKAAGLELWLNPSPITQDLISGDAVKLADGLVLNELELAALAGTNDLEKGIATLRSRYPGQKLVLTLGEQGAIYIGEGHTYRQPAFPVAAVDTTGAGDTFLGYFLAGFLTSRSPEKAMSFAAKASSIAVTRVGAAEAIPYAQEVENSF